MRRIRINAWVRPDQFALWCRQNGIPVVWTWHIKSRMYRGSKRTSTTLAYSPYYEDFFIRESDLELIILYLEKVEVYAD